MHRLHVIVVAAVVAGLAGLAPVASAAPPRVIKAVPDNGQKDVDPGIREIRVTFDQAMNTGGMSIVGGGPTFPKTTGRGRWVSDRTIVLPVQLEPNHEYRMSFNSPDFTNFRNRQGEIAAPYPIIFKTGAPRAGRGAATAPTGPTAEEQREAVKQLRKAVLEMYSYRDLRGVDWAARLNEFGPRLEKTKSAKEFAEVAKELFAPAQDCHLWIEAEGQGFSPFARRVPANADMRTLEGVVPGMRRFDRVIGTGKFDGDIGYVMIATWSVPQAKAALEEAYKVIGAQPKALIVDVRFNAGGAEPLAQEFAGCFTRKTVPYAKHQSMGEGKLGEVYTRSLSPNPARPAYTGKTVVLMGRHNMSSCESFLLMMRAAGATLIGEQTYGSSGNPQPHPLANGVTVFLPSWQDLLLDGTCFEGKGIAPDVKVETKAEDFAKGDPVLEAGLKLLKK